MSLHLKEHTHMHFRMTIELFYTNLTSSSSNVILKKRLTRSKKN